MVPILVVQSEKKAILSRERMVKFPTHFSIEQISIMCLFCVMSFPRPWGVIMNNINKIPAFRALTLQQRRQEKERLRWNIKVSW